MIGFPVNVGASGTAECSLAASNVNLRSCKADALYHRESMAEVAYVAIYEAA